MSKENSLIIDVDQVIENYNTNNPKLKPLDRTGLAERLDCNKQVFSDWKNGRTPKWVPILFELMEIGKCDVKEFIKKI